MHAPFTVFLLLVLAIAAVTREADHLDTSDPEHELMHRLVLQLVFHSDPRRKP